MLSVSASQAPSHPSLAIDTARISIAGTTNVHDFTVFTSTARVTRVRFAGSGIGPNAWDEIVKPGAIEALDITVPAATLTSPKGELDNNMHKALNVKQYPEI